MGAKEALVVKNPWPYLERIREVESLFNPMVENGPTPGKGLKMAGNFPKRKLSPPPWGRGKNPPLNLSKKVFGKRGVLNLFC